MKFPEAPVNAHDALVNLAIALDRAARGAAKLDPRGDLWDGLDDAAKAARLLANFVAGAGASPALAPPRCACGSTLEAGQDECGPCTIRRETEIYDRIRATKKANGTEGHRGAKPLIGARSPCTPAVVENTTGRVLPPCDLLGLAAPAQSPRPCRECGGVVHRASKRNVGAFPQVCRECAAKHAPRT